MEEVEEGSVLKELVRSKSQKLFSSYNQPQSLETFHPLYSSFSSPGHVPDSSYYFKQPSKASYFPASSSSSSYAPSFSHSSPNFGSAHSHFSPKPWSHSSLPSSTSSHDSPPSSHYFATSSSHSRPTTFRPFSPQPVYIPDLDRTPPASRPSQNLFQATKATTPLPMYHPPTPLKNPLTYARPYSLESFPKYQGPSLPQVLPPPSQKTTIGPENRPPVQDPEFYQFDRGGLVKVEKNRIGKEVAGGRGGKGGKKGGSSSGQITWPAEPPLYPNFLLEGDAAGIKGKRKSTSSNQGSISFPEMSFKEPAGSPILLKTKAENGFSNSNFDAADSGWQPSLPYLAPTKEEYVSNDLPSNNDWTPDTDNGYTEKEGESFKEDLKTLLTDDPYGKHFQPHKEPGPPYYSIYEYTYDDEELYPTYTEYDDGEASTFDTKNMMNSSPQYFDYFEDEEDTEEYSSQFMQPETDQRLTTDAPRMPVLELVNAGNNSNGLQEAKKIAMPENTSSDDHEVNRTSLILEPGLDHYPHNAYSFSKALSRKASTDEKQENDNEEGRKRRKAEDLNRSEKRTTAEDWDYRVLSPHLNLQDIHAFTESGLKDNSL